MRRLRKKNAVIFTGVAILSAICIAIMPSVEKKISAPSSRTFQWRSFEEEQDTLSDYQTINNEVKYLIEFQNEDGMVQMPILVSSNPDYYMLHNVDKEYDTMGALFIDETQCPDNGSNNRIVFGHSSKTKDYNFTFLKEYAQKEYYDRFGTLTLSDDISSRTYQIVSFARYDLDDEDVYLGWHNNLFATDQDARNMFLETKPYLLQKTDGAVYSGQQILTLVTCDMSAENARFVLTALEVF